MASFNLPTNVDSANADSTTDPTVQQHQQNHDTVHGVINKLDSTILAPTDGQLIQYSASTGRWVPVTINAVINMGGFARVWGRTAAQGLPTLAESADDDWAFVES